VIASSVTPVDPVDAEESGACVQGAAGAHGRLGPTAEHQVDVAPHDLVEDLPA
jgi:hypothetical protein